MTDLYDDFTKKELIRFIKSAEKQIKMAIDALEVIQYSDSPYISWYNLRAEEALEDIRTEYSFKR